MLSSYVNICKTKYGGKVKGGPESWRFETRCSLIHLVSVEVSFFRVFSLPLCQWRTCGIFIFSSWINMILFYL